MAIEDIVAQFNAKLNAAVGQAMENDVAAMVRVALSNAVETEVYDEYQPHMYKRRGPVDGGLQSQNKDVMVATYDPATMTLEVQDMSRDDESGEGYKFPWDGQKPRPFHEKAQEEVVQNGWFEGALISALRGAGFTVKD